jgi:hypothetical protein
VPQSCRRFLPRTRTCRIFFQYGLDVLLAFICSLNFRALPLAAGLLTIVADLGVHAEVVAAGPADRYLVIDGHKRVAALEQLGRDTVEATVWAMSEAEAVLLLRSGRKSPAERNASVEPERESALQAQLLAATEETGSATVQVLRTLLRTGLKA